MIHTCHKILALSLLATISCARVDGPHKEIPVNRSEKVQGGGVVGYDQVRPIFSRVCASCHPSKSAPDWLDFAQAQQIAKSGRLVNRVVELKTMPPPEKASEVSQQDRDLIKAWVDGGAQERSSDAPKAEVTVVQAPKAIQTCVQCHTLTPAKGSASRYPHLVGQNPEYLKNQLLAFKWRERIDPSQNMNMIAGGLSDEALQAAAEAYAQNADWISEPAATDIQTQPLYTKGKALAEEKSCVVCHLNPDSPSATAAPDQPKLAGQNAAYLRDQLLYFKTGERKNEIMTPLAKDLKNDEIEALQFFFSNAH